MNKTDDYTSLSISSKGRFFCIFTEISFSCCIVIAGIRTSMGIKQT